MPRTRYKAGVTVRISPTLTGKIAQVLEGGKFLVTFVDPVFGTETTTAFAKAELTVEP